MMHHIVFDALTQQLYTLGHDGRRYTAAEIERAYERAAHGDEAARAVLADIDFTAELADASPEAWLRAELDDCPECQAARARGEVPASLGLAELRAHAAANVPMRRAWAKPVRWRKRKQVRRVA